MIVMADNNFLVGMFDKRIDSRALAQALKRRDLTIGIPTPVLAEFLVRDNNSNRTNFLNKQSSFSQIFNLDSKSARMSATIQKDLLEKTSFYDNKPKGKDKQTIKVDIQILGITLANQAPKLYTTDKGIHQIVRDLDLPLELADFENESELFDLPLFRNQ